MHGAQQPFLCIVRLCVGGGGRGIEPVKKKDQRKIAIIFLSTRLNMCFGCSKEPSHWDGSFEYPQHMFWLRNKKNNFQLRTLIRGAGGGGWPFQAEKK